ncbi:MAG: tartrate dehydrogenase, partial [Saprospiraceae bacterium]|nr:tartrate dehydrogenase [Saprospiraceae bacterium]
MKTYNIATIPGDGIGKEVIPESTQVLEVIAAKFGFTFKFKNYDYGCERYAKYGKMMPDDGLARLRDNDSIFLGAVGYPGVPDHVSLWGLLIPIRRTFQQYINLRPVRLLEGISSPLKNPGKIDFYIVRENNEGEYSSSGGSIYEGTDHEVVIQESIFTRRGVDRVMTYAFELADSRNKKITSATKSNGIIHTMPFWDQRFQAIGQAFPQIEQNQFHIDILAAHFVQHPDWFDVVVASNLFGDILSDLGPAVVGGMGIAAGANINPERNYPSMFEPVHGSAPDIAGKNVANPIACLWTAQMMLDHLGE